MFMRGASPLNESQLLNKQAFYWVASIGSYPILPILYRALVVRLHSAF